MENQTENIDENEGLQQQEIAAPLTPPPVTQVEYYVMHDGEVVRSGECPDNLVQLQAFNEGETVHRGVPEKAETEEPTFTHTLPRAAEMPPIPDQLDVIWKILARNPDMLGTEGREMLSRIQEVKSKFPKDRVYVQSTNSFVEK